MLFVMLDFVKASFRLILPSFSSSRQPICCCFLYVCLFEESQAAGDHKRYARIGQFELNVERMIMSAIDDRHFCSCRVNMD